MPEYLKKLSKKQCLSKMISYMSHKHPDWSHDRVIAASAGECGVSKNDLTLDTGTRAALFLAHYKDKYPHLSLQDNLARAYQKIYKIDMEVDFILENGSEGTFDECLMEIAQDFQYVQDSFDELITWVKANTGASDDEEAREVAFAIINSRKKNKNKNKETKIEENNEQSWFDAWQEVADEFEKRRKARGEPTAKEKIQQKVKQLKIKEGSPKKEILEKVKKLKAKDFTGDLEEKYVRYLDNKNQIKNFFAFQSYEPYSKISDILEANLIGFNDEEIDENLEHAEDGDIDAQEWILATFLEKFSDVRFSYNTIAMKKNEETGNIEPSLIAKGVNVDIGRSTIPVEYISRYNYRVFFEGDPYGENLYGDGDIVDPRKIHKIEEKNEEGNWIDISKEFPNFFYDQNNQGHREGKGWFGDPERHSRARKTGKADLTTDAARGVGRPRKRGNKPFDPTNPETFGTGVGAAKRTTEGQELRKRGIPLTVSGPEAITRSFKMINTETGEMVEGEVMENFDKNTVQMQPVSSSNVKSSGVSNNELVVNFLGNKENKFYRFKFRDPATAMQANESLKNSGSPGRWIWNNIRGHVAGEKITPSKIGPSLERGKPTIGGTSASLAEYSISNTAPSRVKGYKGMSEKLARQTSNPIEGYNKRTKLNVDKGLQNLKLMRERGSPLFQNLQKRGIKAKTDYILDFDETFKNKFLEGKEDALDPELFKTIYFKVPLNKIKGNRDNIWEHQEVYNVDPKEYYNTFPPVTVRPLDDEGNFEFSDGFHRVNFCMRENLPIPCMVWKRQTNVHAHISGVYTKHRYLVKDSECDSDLKKNPTIKCEKGKKNALDYRQEKAYEKTKQLIKKGKIKQLGRGQGRGWFGDPERHSRARKTGKADLTTDYILDLDETFTNLGLKRRTPSKNKIESESNIDVEIKEEIPIPRIKLGPRILRLFNELSVGILSLDRAEPIDEFEFREMRGMAKNLYKNLEFPSYSTSLPRHLKELERIAEIMEKTSSPYYKRFLPDVHNLIIKTMNMVEGLKFEAEEREREKEKISFTSLGLKKKGQGWHGESERHSRAKKYGKADFHTCDFTMTGMLTRSGEFDYTAEGQGVKIKTPDNLKWIAEHTEHVPVFGKNGRGAHNESETSLIGFAHNLEYIPPGKVDDHAHIKGDVETFKDIKELSDLDDPNELPVSFGYDDIGRGKYQKMYRLHHLAVSLDASEKDRCSTMNGSSCNISRKNDMSKSILKPLEKIVVNIKK